MKSRVTAGEVGAGGNGGRVQRSKRPREFGATTGRARRGGWFDAVATRYAGMINGIDEIAVTNLDGLDSHATIRVCIAYQHGSKKSKSRPATRASSRIANREKARRYFS